MIKRWKLLILRPQVGAGYFANRLLRNYFCRLIWRTLRIFTDAKCGVLASALTYYSIFAVVPLLALAFGVSQGFGMESQLKNWISTKLVSHEELLHYLLQFIDSTLERTRGGLIAGIGVVLLLYTVISMLRHIEMAFNTILGQKHGRSWWRLMVDYLAMIFICPLLVVVVSSINFFLHSQHQKMLESADVFITMGAKILNLMMFCAPWALVWVTFAFFFMFCSNGKIRLLPGIISGIFAGSLFMLLQDGYFYLQKSLAGYNYVYGSFSILPLFLIWIYLIWMITLLGISLGAAMQNLREHDLVDSEDDQSSVRHMINVEFIMLLAAQIASDFETGRRPPSEEELSERCAVGPRRVSEGLYLLVESRIISAVVLPDENDYRYQPAVSSDKLTIDFVRRKIALMFHIIRPQCSETRQILDNLHELLNQASQQTLSVKLTDIYQLNKLKNSK